MAPGATLGPWARGAKGMLASDSSRWWVLAEGAVAVAVVSLPLCLGGAPPWTLWLLTALSSVAALSWLGGAWKHRRRVTWHPALLVPVALAVWGLVSLVPVPPGLMALVMPPAAELRATALLPLGFDAWRPLTMDAPGTWRAVARCVALGLLLFTSLQLGRLESARRRLLTSVVVAGAVVAVVGFGHLVSGAQSLFGLRRFEGSVPLLSFFGNTNHESAYLAFAASVALAMALDARSRDGAIAWAATAVTTGLGVFLCLSRGGIATFVATWVLVGLLTLARGGRTRLRDAAPWIIIGVVGLVALSIASDDLLERLDSVSTVERLQQTKLDLWPMFLSGARRYWPGGMGLGAFELAFGRFQTSQLDVTFTHPENLVLQWLAELGPLGMLALAGVVSLSVRQFVRQARGAVLEPVLLLAVLGAGLHDLFDFALELNALPVAVVVVLGVVASRVPQPDPERARRPVRRSGILAGAGLVGLGVAAAAEGLPTHESPRQRLVALASSGAPLVETRRGSLEAIERHPADWVPYAVMAFQVSVHGTAPEALEWVNRVLFLRPRDAGVHGAAGHALARLGRSAEAAREFRKAWELGDWRSLDEGVLVAANGRVTAELLGSEPIILTRAWERLLELDRPDDAQRLLDEASSTAPGSGTALEAQVLRIRAAERAGRWLDAVRAYDELPAPLRAREDLIVANARALARVGRGDEAIATLEQRFRRSPSSLPVAFALTELLAAARRTAEAREVLQRTRPFVVGSSARSTLFQRESELWSAEERWPRALEALQTASRIEPTRADLKYRIARVYEQMGSLHSALDEVRRGRMLDTPEGARAQNEWIKRLELAMAGQGLE